jgi:excisionase family DNA binding protein
MDVGVDEVAARLGVSTRRVRTLIDVGRIPARRLSGRWLIDEASVPRSVFVARPMSPRVAWALISILSGESPDGLSQPERSRLLSRYRHMLAASDRSAVLRSWLPKRALLMRRSVAPGDAAELLADSRVARSGISDPRSGMSSSGEVEAYVSPRDMDRVMAQYLLSDVGRPNVWLHVSDHTLAEPVPLGLVVADLADHDGSREDANVERLLATP